MAAYRRFLAPLLLAGLTLAPASRAAVDQVIVFGHILAESTAHHRQLIWASQELARRSGARVQLTVYPAGQIGSTDAQVIEGFHTGTADMAYLSFGHLLEVFPPLAIGAGPFVFRDFEHWQGFADSAIYHELVTEMEKELDLKAFGLAYYGARHVTTRTPLSGPEALRDLVIRVPNIPTMILTFRALGAEPVPLPFKETHQALRERIVDAQENPLPAILAMRFYEVTPVVNQTAHILDAQIIVMDGERWRSLDSGAQQLLESVLAEAARRVTRDVRAEELSLPERLRALGVSFNPIDREPLIRAIVPLHRSAYFPWGGELYDRIQALR